MRKFSSKTAVSSFAIPDGAPPVVVEAKQRFDDVAAQARQAHDELRAAELADGRAADVRRVADNLLKGKPTADPTKEQTARDKELREAATTLVGIDTALDESGNALAHSIAEHSDAWVEKLEQDEGAAAGRLKHALQEARAALVELEHARAALDWLRNFSVRQATIGEQSGFAGLPKLRVKADRDLRHRIVERLDPALGLDLVHKVLEPPEEPKVHKASTPSESRFDS